MILTIIIVFLAILVCRTMYNYYKDTYKTCKINLDNNYDNGINNNKD